MTNTELDTRGTEFAEECRDQSHALREDTHEQEILNWLEAVANTDEWK